jgi:hypothetical protein
MEMETENRGPWPPVNMVLRAAAGPAASSPGATDLAATAGGPANDSVDPAEVAERVFRMMQRDLRLERERRQDGGGRRWR